MRPAVVLLAALVCAGPATAQILSSTETLVPTGNANDRRLLLEGDTTLRATAACVVKRAAGQSAYLLGTVPGSDQEDKVISAMQSRLDWCMPGAPHGALRFPAAVLRGKLAEELYRTEFPAGIDTKPVAEVVTWEYPFTAADRGDQGRMVLEQTGRCVVMKQPASVMALIATQPFTLGESSQIAALRPTLGECLIAGSNAQISRQSLRGLLAEALFEYARAAKAGFAAPAAIAKRN